MNTPLRRISLVVMAMFVTLMVALTSIQVFQAGDLNADDRNRRATYREQGRERGPIVVAGTPIATSVPVDTPYAFQRTYANGPLYAPVTGYSSIVFGQTQIETAANTVLNGTAPSLWRQRLGALVTGRQPQGGSVELTLDPEAQQAAWDALDGREGAVVALDPSTGAILALVSTPSFDPNLLAGHDTAAVNEAWQTLINDPGRPLVNRAIAGDTYAPGSTFKLIDLAAALSTGDYDAETRVPALDVLELPGSNATISNPGGARCDDGETATLMLALQKSCNTPFSQLAITLGEQAIRDQAEAFGWGAELSVPLTVTPSRLGEIESEAALGQTAIGQLDVRTTPMQMAMVAAGIANDGELMTPYLVATERAADLSVVAETSPDLFSEPVTPEVARTMTEMMVNVVANGTGSRARIDGVDVAGKTGTAESGFDEGTVRDYPHAWFTSFAPAEDPQVAVAVVLVNGADPNNAEFSGGQLAAPIAKAVIEAVLR
ncbi:cell division protein FtsI [Serinibacter arcticus]|uniref:Cell division protein FtsI n=1 Tax=Serinibacter arcticus TaxID=1655435 RepID=A0A2U1ZVZ8_9MICO|nr:penicillin-binding protein 2 [Serinibacter arcticus]PWD51149.1 cell division protein FtsI [Serinibacter arcticus]